MGLMTQIRDALESGEGRLPEHLDIAVRNAASKTRGPAYVLERIRKELEMISEEDMARMGPMAFREMGDISAAVRALSLGRTRLGEVISWNIAEAVES